MRAPRPPADPIGWNGAFAATFLTLAAVRLTIPSAPYFDEIHYLPVARDMLALAQAGNIEHPPLGKQILALGLALLGDRPLGWRMMPLLFATLALFSAMRAIWFASESRAASLLTGFFLATGFPLLVQARIAMLDIFMLGFVMLALWMCAAALRAPERARPRLVLAGLSLGAAIACKWNALPLLVLPGLAFLAIRVTSARRDFITTERGPPISGISLLEAFVWLGLLPLAVYAASYWPFPLFTRQTVFFTGEGYFSGLLALHEQMLRLQTELKTPHPYQSGWADWVLNRRPIWYLYEHADGARRGVLLVGNPLTMLAGLPALAWCAWVGVAGEGSGRRRPDALAVALLYAASLGLWIAAPKPVQFYYHYLLPSCFLLAALALATERLWRAGQRIVTLALVLGAAGMFAWFYPILTAAPLPGEDAFVRWTWLNSWR